MHSSWKHVAALCVVLFANAVRADEKADRLTFPLAGEPQYAGRIDEIDPSGVARVSQVKTPFGDRPVSPLSEGLFLAIAQSPADFGPGLKNATLVRVKVDEVLDKNSLIVEVGEKAASVLKTGMTLVLFRPIASTALMKQAPEMAPLTQGEPDGPGGGVSPGLNPAATMNNLKQIGLALHNFHDAYGRMPPAHIVGKDGKPWHSWRVLILPFVEAAELFNQYRFDEPWDGPNNKRLAAKMPAAYSDGALQDAKGPWTAYVAITGEQCAFSDKGEKAKEDGDWDSRAPGRRFQDFTDGLSNTVVVGMVAPDKKVPWMKPEDLVVGEKPPMIGEPGGFMAPFDGPQGKMAPFLFADGSVRMIGSTVASDILNTLLTCNGNEMVDHAALGGPGNGPTARPMRPVIEIVAGEDGPRAFVVMRPAEPGDVQGDDLPPPPARSTPAVEEGGPAAGRAQPAPKPKPAKRPAGEKKMQKPAK